KEAVEAIQDGTYTKEKIIAWKERLSTVFNRGFWDGYYLGRKMGEWSDAYGSKATTRKIFIGKGIKYFSKAKVGEFFLETHSLMKGDKIIITGPTTGIIETSVDEIRVDDKSVDEVTKGKYFSIQLDETIRASDKLYKVVSA
ncbi:MAG: U32 family peptidase, partial [Ignavibacteriae bacterium]|nr:U32 family peptidase [Ignavibacteriota bacterium]